MLRHARITGSYDAMACAWLNEFAKLDNRLAFSYPGSGPRIGRTWYLCLHPFTKSSVLVWPCDLCELPGTGASYLVPRALSELCFRSIFSVHEDDLEVAPLVWRSWLWQLQAIGKQKHSLQPGVRAFFDNEPGAFARVACAMGWWGLSRPTIQAYARHLGMPVSRGSSLLELLFDTTKSTLGLSDGSVMHTIHRRIATDEQASAQSEVLMQADDALVVVDQFDRQKVAERQEQAKKEAEAWQHLGKEIMLKLQAVREASGSAARKPARNRPAPQRLAVPHHCTQAAAKKLLPPGAFLWRGATRGEWCAHLKPYRRVTCPFWRCADSSDEALKACLSHVWQQYAASMGQEPHQVCTVAGLFVEPAVAASSSSA